MHFSQKQLQNNQHLCHWQCQAQQQHWNSGDFVQHHYLSLSWSFFASFAPHCKKRKDFASLSPWPSWNFLLHGWLSAEKAWGWHKFIWCEEANLQSLSCTHLPYLPFISPLTPISVVGTKGQDAGAQGPVVMPWGVLNTQAQNKPKILY